jgi:hypothetical protein
VFRLDHDWHFRGLKFSIFAPTDTQVSETSFKVKIDLAGFSFSLRGRSTFIAGLAQ